MTESKKPSHMIQTFALFVAKLRDMRGLSQAELSGRIGKSPSYISQLERGKIDNLGLDTYCEIMAVLDMGPGEWLIAYDQLPKAVAQ